MLALPSRHLGRGAEALMLGVGWSPGTNAPGFLMHVLSLLAVASPSRRCCCAALAPTIAAVAVTLPSRRRSAIAVASSLRFRRRSPRVRALCSPVLPRRPCRLPLASRPCRQSRRSRRCCPGGRSRAYAPRAVLVSLLGRPWLRTPLSVIVGIVVGASVGVLVAGGGGCHHPRVGRHQCVVDSCASGCLCCTRAHCGGCRRRAP